MANDRKHILSGVPWEEQVGYSRAIVVNNFVFVSGTTATSDSGNIVGPNNAYLQTKQALQNIEKALFKAGSSMDHVVRTRMYVTDISLWEEYGKGHSEVFRNIKPATTMVEVSNLMTKEMMIEIEADAIMPGI